MNEPAPTVGDMAAFGASESACYRWPLDTAEHRAMRAAYCDGAAWAAVRDHELAASLREFADDLWRVEYRIDVGEDAELLLRAANALGPLDTAQK